MADWQFPSDDYDGDIWEKIRAVGGQEVLQARYLSGLGMITKYLPRVGMVAELLSGPDDFRKNQDQF